MLTAINVCIERDRVSDQQRRALQRLLDGYRGVADGPLVALIETTARRLKNLT